MRIPIIIYGYIEQPDHMTLEEAVKETNHDLSVINLSHFKMDEVVVHIGECAVDEWSLGE